MSTIPVKITYNNDLRRISIDNSGTFAVLHETIANLYRIPTEDREIMEIHYIDDEGDKVCISSDIELKEALYIMQQNPQPSFRLILSLRSRNTKPASDSKFVPPINTSPNKPSMCDITNRILKLIATGKQEDLLKAKDILITEFPDSSEYSYLKDTVEWFLAHPEEASGYLMTALSSGIISVEQFCKNPFLHAQFNAGLSQLNTLWQQFVPQAQTFFRQPGWTAPFMPFVPQPTPTQPPAHPPFPFMPHPATWDPSTSGTVPPIYPTPFCVFPPPVATGSFTFPQQTSSTTFNPTPFTFPTTPAPPSPFIFNSPPSTPTPSTPLPEVPKFVPQVQSPQPTSSTPQVTDTFIFDEIVSPVSKPQTPVPAPQHPSVAGLLGNWWNMWQHTNVQNPDRYKEQLAILEDMGWTNREECLKALDKTGGDVLKAVETLLANQTANVSI
jgi:hypothetical protein